jgi:plastocyanin
VGATATNAIAIQSFKFNPDHASAKAGATITVTNGDGTDHSLTADDGSFDTGVFSGGTKTITLSKAGSFSYHCKIHNFMTGVIQVSG